MEQLKQNQKNRKKKYESTIYIKEKRKKNDNET